MKKKLLSILVILCMILSLAACGSAPKAEPDENGNYVVNGSLRMRISQGGLLPISTIPLRNWISIPVKRIAATVFSLCTSIQAPAMLTLLRNRPFPVWKRKLQADRLYSGRGRWGRERRGLLLRSNQRQDIQG